MYGRGKITTAVVMPIFAGIFFTIAFYIFTYLGIHKILDGEITAEAFFAEFGAWIIICNVFGFVLDITSLGLTISSLRDERTGFRIFWLIVIIVTLLYGIGQAIYFFVGLH